MMRTYGATSEKPIVQERVVDLPLQVCKLGSGVDVNGHLVYSMDDPMVLMTCCGGSEATELVFELSAVVELAVRVTHIVCG